VAPATPEAPQRWLADRKRGAQRSGVIREIWVIKLLRRCNRRAEAKIDCPAPYLAAQRIA